MCSLVHCLIRPRLRPDRMRVRELNDCINNWLIHCSFFLLPASRTVAADSAVLHKSSVFLARSNEFSRSLSWRQPLVKTSSPLRPQRTSKVSFEECTRRPGCLASCPCSKNVMKPNVPSIFFWGASKLYSPSFSEQVSLSSARGLNETCAQAPSTDSCNGDGARCIATCLRRWIFKKEKGKAHNSAVWCVCICCEISVTQSRNRNMQQTWLRGLQCIFNISAHSVLALFQWKDSDVHFGVADFLQICLGCEQTEYHRNR